MATATSKNVVTRLSVISKALTLEVWSDEERDVLERMAVSLSRPRKPSSGPSKTQIVNANLSDVLVDAMSAHGEPVTAKWIADNVPGIPSAQKAVAVVKASGGRIVKFYEGRNAMYRLA